MNKIMVKDIRVCMLVSRFAPQYSGAALQCYSLLNKMKMYNVKPIVISISDDKNIPAEYQIGGIQVYKIFVSGKRGFKHRIKELIDIFQAIYRIRDRVEILHIHCLSLPGLLAGVITGKSIIQKLTLVGEDDFNTISKQRFGWLKLFLFSKVKKIVSISPALTETFKNWKYESKLVEIPNGVDTVKFSPVKNFEEKKRIRAGLSMPVNVKIVLFVGPLIRRKGIDILIEGWDKVMKSHKAEMLLILAGPEYIAGNREFDTDYSANIKKQILGHDLGRFIKYTGIVSNPEEYYKVADIFVFPSRSEGLPNALLEALSSGLPCVSSRIPGITNSIIEDGRSGLLYDTEDSNGLAEALLKVIDNDKLAAELASNARRLIVDRYRIEHITEKYYNLYQYV